MIESEDGDHVDVWLDTPTFDDSEAYAKFVLEYKRMPAFKQIQYAPWMQQFKLFCVYEGKVYRCTGASRLGDVWLTENFDQDSGYQKRVNVKECSKWSNNHTINL